MDAWPPFKFSCVLLWEMLRCEEQFKRGARGRLVREIATWVKMFLAE